MIGRDQVSEGDYIVFKSATRDGCRKAKRKVKRFDSFGRPLVGYFGCSDFVVHWHEVLGVHKP